MSRPLQVYLEDKDLKRLEAWTRARGWTKSQAVRAAIRALIKTEDEDPLLAMSGMIDGLPRDGSENFDKYLMETYVAERAAPYRARRRRAKPSVRR